MLHFIHLIFYYRPLKIIFNNKKQRKDILDNASKIKNIPAKNCLTMRIILKDLTVQQRDQNKKRRAEKIKQQQKALKVKKKTVENEIILSGLFLFGVGLPSRNNNLISGS
jgi:hypothetical protein